MIHGHRLGYASKREEVLDNFKRSTRGAIRRPPNVITWVNCLMVLKGFGETDAAAVVRQHNAKSSKAGQLTGSKALAVKNILGGLPLPALKVLTDHVLSVGWDKSAFSDDALSGKRYLPGHQFRGGGKVWQSRTKVVPASCLLMFEHTVAAHGRRPEHMLKKIDKAGMDEEAEMAAAVHHLMREVSNVMPISMDQLQKGFADKYIQGDPQVELEVQSAMHQKDEKITVRDMKSLCALLDMHCGTMPVKAERALQPSQLEDDQFSLLKRQLSYDLQAVRVARGKLATHENVVYHSKLSWRIKAFENSKNAACYFMQNNVKLIYYQQGEQLLREINQFKLALFQQTQLDQSMAVCHLAVPLN